MGESHHKRVGRNNLQCGLNLMEPGCLKLSLDKSKREFESLILEEELSRGCLKGGGIGFVRLDLTLKWSFCGGG